MPSRQDANGRNVQVGLNFSRLAYLGPGGMLQAAVTKVVAIGRRLGEGLADDAEAPDIVLFDPADYPGGACLTCPWLHLAGASRRATCLAAMHPASGASNPSPLIVGAGLPPPPEGQAYNRVLVDKFIAGKLRPHQVEGVRLGPGSIPTLPIL